MPEIKVNGRTIAIDPDARREDGSPRRLLDVLVDEGFVVPYYCWHPALKPAGNCRMCLVKVSNSRKLEVSCMWPIQDGMEVETEGTDVKAGRESVLEYMLINHPLDCPICDKAGECMLQDHTYDYRHGVSRFREDKVIKGTKDLGPNIKIWGNRCIACTRCVRFTEDISGDGELSIVQRGDHSVADVHPEIPIDNPMSLNVVDICPVGALIDKNFLYQARVWFAKRHDTICGGCSRGCNVTATTYEGEVKRLQPRENAEVNGHWMCDAGRLGITFLTSDQRLTEPKGQIHEMATPLIDCRKGALAIVASTAATNEELFLIRAVAEALQARVAFVGLQGPRWESKSGFVIESDKTPNTAGAERFFGTLTPVSALGDEVDALFYINAIPGLEVPPEVIALAERVKWIAVADVLFNALVSRARFVMPQAAWAETDGTWINRDGRLQRIRAVIDPPKGSKTGAAWLQELLVAIAKRRAAISVEGVFRQAFPGLTFASVGPLGLDLTPAPAAADAPHLGAK